MPGVQILVNLDKFKHYEVCKSTTEAVLLLMSLKILISKLIKKRLMGFLCLFAQTIALTRSVTACQYIHVLHQ